MTRILCLVAVLAIATSSATAEPYWIAYEGNDFPENEGWIRHATDPPAERWLEDGSLFIDSRAGANTVDNYTVYFDSGLGPEPSETFVMCWALNVHEATPWNDPGVYAITEDHWSVAFIFDEGSVLSVYEANMFAEFEPGVFHEFELRSADMRNYRLFIDGDLAIDGTFFEGLTSGRVGWGDIAGGGSLTAWDYFRFGVVPEPSTWLLVLCALPWIRRRETSLAGSWRPVVCGGR